MPKAKKSVSEIGILGRHFAVCDGEVQILGHEFSMPAPSADVYQVFHLGRRVTAMRPKTRPLERLRQAVIFDQASFSDRRVNVVLVDKMMAAELLLTGDLNIKALKWAEEERQYWGQSGVFIPTKKTRLGCPIFIVSELPDKATHGTLDKQGRFLGATL